MDDTKVTFSTHPHACTRSYPTFRESGGYIISWEDQSRSPRLPLSFLKRCYLTTLTETALGFILGLTGVLIYAWVGLSIPVGGFSAICLSVCVVAGIWAIA